MPIALCARYHVAGGKGVFYARAPYMNKDLGAGAHATRFIGLAPVGNPAKQKFLHALALVPAVDMDQQALTVRPDLAVLSGSRTGRRGRKLSASGRAYGCGNGEPLRDDLTPVPRPSICPEAGHGPGAQCAVPLHASCC